MSRTLRDIPNGAAVMVDANIVVYALTPQSLLHPSCKDLLERGARGDLQLYLTVSIAADVLHRAMVLEVLAMGQAGTIHSGERVVILSLPCEGDAQQGGAGGFLSIFLCERCRNL